MHEPLGPEELTRRLAEAKPALRDKYGLARIGLFGSWARGEQGPDSDVDLLVELERPIGLFAFQRLEDELTHLLGCRVDLVTPGALKPHIGAEILRSVRNV